MKGTIIEARGNPKPHDFDIKGADGKIYFTHLGDIKDNEDKLFDKQPNTIYLEKGDEVEFTPFEPHAIHVKKLR
jgi:hypothetical protein